MKTCKVEGCNNVVWGDGLCKYHKPRKKIPTKLMTKEESTVRHEDIQDMQFFFLSIWKKRPHFSEVSRAYLGSEALSIYFHHILPKNKYPQAAFDKENIIILTPDEHTNVESDIYRYGVVNLKRSRLKVKYGLD